MMTNLFSITLCSFLSGLSLAGPTTVGGGGSVSIFRAPGTVGGGGGSGAPVFVSQADMDALLNAFELDTSIYSHDAKDDILPIEARSIEDLYEVDAIDSNGNKILFIESAE